MDKIIIEGGNTRLQGEVTIEGAKNAVLPLLAATILPVEGKTVLKNVPILSDVFTMNHVVRGLNIAVDFDEALNQVTVDATGAILDTAPYEYVSQMRASIVVLGPILARNGHAKVSMPGGCTIGSRPIDLHLKGLEAMGASIHQEGGDISATAEKLKGAHFYMDFPSVGATQNLMMAATLAEGTTVLENVAREPEIVDLANLLNKMGARVSGAGTETLTIRGVAELHGAEHNVVQDRIEAGTFMVAAAMTSGNVLIKDAVWEHNRPLISKLREMGVDVREEEAGIRVKSDISKLKPVTVKTLPHPGFPTDMQAQFMAMLTIAEGTGLVTETVFENRFMNVPELNRMGADIKIEGKSAVIQGVKNLEGSNVVATDLRAGAALILSGMVAEGQTKVTEIYHVERGYVDIVKKLSSLGANIEKIED